MAVLGRDLHAVEPDAPLFDPLTLPLSATVWVVRADTVVASNRGPDAGGEGMGQRVLDLRRNHRHAA